MDGNGVVARARREMRCAKMSSPLRVKGKFLRLFSHITWGHCEALHVITMRSYIRPLWGWMRSLCNHAYSRVSVHHLCEITAYLCISILKPILCLYIYTAHVIVMLFDLFRQGFHVVAVNGKNSMQIRHWSTCGIWLKQLQHQAVSIQQAVAQLFILSFCCYKVVAEMGRYGKTTPYRECCDTLVQYKTKNSTLTVHCQHES